MSLSLFRVARTETPSSTHFAQFTMIVDAPIAISASGRSLVARFYGFRLEIWTEHGGAAVDALHVDGIRERRLGVIIDDDQLLLLMMMIGGVVVVGGASLLVADHLGIGLDDRKGGGGGGGGGG